MSLISWRRAALALLITGGLELLTFLGRLAVSGARANLPSIW